MKLKVLSNSLSLSLSRQHSLTQCTCCFGLQVLQPSLWSIWLSGFILIGLSIYATQNLPTFDKDPPKNNKFNDNGPRIAIFTAPGPFTGSLRSRQSLAIRSWLGLSPQITVVLFSQDPSVVDFAANFGSRLLVEPNIDFT